MGAMAGVQDTDGIPMSHERPSTNVERWKEWIQRQIAAALLEKTSFDARADERIQSRLRDLEERIAQLTKVVETNPKKYYEYAQDLRAQVNESQQHIEEIERLTSEVKADARQTAQLLAVTDRLADIADWVVERVLEPVSRATSRLIEFLEPFRSRRAKPVDQIIQRNQGQRPKYRRRSTDR